MLIPFKAGICVIFVVIGAELIRAQSVTKQAVTQTQNGHDTGVITELVARIEALESKVVKLEQKGSECQKDVDDLRVEVAVHKHTIVELETESKERKKLTAKMQAEKAGRRRDIGKRNKKYGPTDIQQNGSILQRNNTTTKLRDVSDSTTAETEPVHHVLPRMVHGNVVSFFAKQVSTPLQIDPNGTVTFDVVESNEGGAYDANSGSFIAPVAGTYVFSITLTTFSAENAMCGFVKNGVRVTTISLNGITHHYDSSSQTVVFHLQQNDTITIQQEDALAYFEGNGRSLFTGYLLYEDCRQVSGQDVAFFAKIVTTPRQVGRNAAVIFEVVDLNIGEAYNSQNGSFVAPVSGTYVFSVTLMAYSIFDADCGFALNGERFSKLLVSGSQANPATVSGSQTTTVHLHQGDVLTIQQADSDGYLEGTEHSLFTGFLMSEDKVCWQSGA